MTVSFLAHTLVRSKISTNTSGRFFGNFGYNSVFKNSNRNFLTQSTTRPQVVGQPNIYRRPVRLRDFLKDPSGQVRKALLISALIVAVSVVGWKGTHLYIENYLHPTNPDLSEEVRNYLRGAFLREEIEPDPAMAEEYLTLARDLILENKELASDSLEFVKLNLRLANIYKIRKRYVDAIHVYVQTWQVLSSVSKTDAEWQEKRKELLNLGLNIGQLCLKLGESQLAKNYLVQGFQYIINDSKLDLDQADMSTRKLSVDYRLTLGGVYALEGEFEPALSLYKSSLEDILKAKPNEGLHPWGCIEALALNYISEVTYAKTKDAKQALPWAWKSHKACEPFQNLTLEGDATSAVTLQTLGNLYEKLNDNQQAIACLSNAILSAEKACDSELTHNLGLQLARLQPESPNTKLKIKAAI